MNNITNYQIYKQRIKSNIVFTWLKLKLWWIAGSKTRRLTRQKTIDFLLYASVEILKIILMVLNMVLVAFLWIYIAFPLSFIYLMFLGRNASTESRRGAASIFRTFKELYNKLFNRIANIQYKGKFYSTSYYDYGDYFKDSDTGDWMNRSNKEMKEYWTEFNQMCKENGYNTVEPYRQLGKL